MEDAALMDQVAAGQPEAMTGLSERSRLARGATRRRWCRPTCRTAAPRTGKGYRLHSVGWNLTDEGGAYAEVSLDNLKRLEHGDWVWSRWDQK